MATTVETCPTKCEGNGDASGGSLALDLHLRIGRGPENQIILEGDSVSRRHAHLEMRGNSWWVVDENGVALNVRERSSQSIVAVRDERSGGRGLRGHVRPNRVHGPVRPAWGTGAVAAHE